MTPKEEFEYALKTLRTLMGRGMPEPRWFTEFDGSFHHVDTTVNTAFVGRHSQMAPAAVLDLLAMHVLRWVNHPLLGLRHGIVNGGDPEDVLRLALKLTAHLEPR